jgi:protein involved in polysaccharide export with SLBB domain
MMYFRLLVGAVCVFFLASSCSYKTKNILFKNPTYNDYYKAERKLTGAAVIKMNADSNATAVYQYRYAVDEIVQIRFLNFPKVLLEKIAEGVGALQVVQSQNGGGQVRGVGASTAANTGFQFVIDLEGNIGLPLVGRVNVVGKTMLEIRNQIEALYSDFVKDAQVDIGAPSMRVIVLGEGQQQVVSLPEERTQLTEVLAIAGGLPFTARAKKVQIIRGNLNNPQIIWVNLQQLATVNSPDLVIQHNDIIYIEPRGLTLATRELSLVTGVLGVLNFVFTIILLAR